MKTKQCDRCGGTIPAKSDNYDVNEYLVDENGECKGSPVEHNGAYRCGAWAVEVYELEAYFG